MGLTETCIKCETSIHNFAENLEFNEYGDAVSGDVYEQVSCRCKICGVKQKISLFNDGTEKRFIWGKEKEVYKSLRRKFNKQPSLLNKLRKKIDGIDFSISLGASMPPLDVRVTLSKNKHEEEDDEPNWILVASRKTNKVCSI